MHTVYAFGMVGPSTLYILNTEFPAPNGYGEIESIHPSLAGEAANGAYVLARLGVATKLNGNWLGTDAESRRAIDTYTAQGVDCSAITLKPDYNAINEIVISDKTSRTVFGRYVKLLFSEVQWNQPDEADICASQIVCLDPFFHDASRTTAEICVRHAIPFVTCDADPDSIVAQAAAAVVISEEFTERALAGLTSAEIYDRYAATCSGLVVLTHGSGDIWYGRDGQPPSFAKPFPIEVRDTTGAGDSFRAGLIYAMLQGQDDAGLIRTASAVAALVCQSFPSVLESPTAAELAAFLDDHTP